MEEEFESPLVYQLSTGKVSMPVFSRWSAPRRVPDVSDALAVGGDVDDNASTGSSGSMPPLLDHVDSD